MQYLLTQAEVERKVDEHIQRISAAMVDVLKKHGARVHPNEPTFSPLDLLIADLKTAIKTP